jgi:dTDP-4-amino-4,6-dideoxygalactose transaminase
MISVTKAFLPPLANFQHYVARIWESGQLTNQGSLLKEFETKLQGFLKTQNIHFVTNGTIALQLALKSLDIIEGEIVTTPFSYVATVSSILWERCNPVFVDIHADSFCIDPSKIEQAITKDTKAIMAVHVFGYPCEVEKIKEIAKKHNLKVIYDGAHAFGSVYKGKSLLDYGDVSTCSFHSTKLFHTIEGGCVIAKDKDTSDKIELIKRFGHNFDDHICLGMNAKASEFQAAMGLCNFDEIKNIINERKKTSNFYDHLLKNSFPRPLIPKDFEYNYAYYPIVLPTKEKTVQVIEDLNKYNIFPRRYFYPSLNKLPYLKERWECPVSEDISSRVLCLPLYCGLPFNEIEKICEVILK